MPSKNMCKVIAFLAIFIPLAMVSGEEVSLQPPPVYQEKLAPLLTPLDEVLHAQPVQKDGDDGVILLDEVIHYLDEKGGRCMVFHRINKAWNDSGVKDLAEDVWSYRKANQKIHLVLARTILPDGSQIPVQPGAAILQSPQRQADYSLYDDQGELRLIFSNVKPGTITETIVVLEESQFRIPGEYSSVFSWAAGWPMQKVHYVIEMPDATAERLKINTAGAGVPEPEKKQVSRDRLRFTWNGKNIGSLPHEQNRPPTLQTGPALWMTTLHDWDAFAKWYAPLVEERSKIQPGLAAKIEEWTKSAHTPKEILDVLMAKVATDVRYVGLEFGTADLQPHDCNAVWDNQYGDCKDKANLLRAMLAHKGISAYIVLLNTENAGVIQRKSPDYHQFSHAIVAVELEHGQYVYCDPTISYAKPGDLSPSDADRDVLLIKNNAAEWGHTPASEAGTMNYDLDLKLGADGELSGWLTQESSGYYGLWYADDYLRMDKDRLRQTAHDILQGFFKGAEIVDVTKTPLEKWDGTYRLKTYFIVHAANRDKTAKRSFPFPQSGTLFTDPGPDKKRVTPYYLWADTVKMTAHIKLPDGVVATDVPKPYKLQSPPLDISARWEASGQTCTATLELHTKKNVVKPDQFGVLYNAILSVHSWLDNPLALSDSGAGDVLAAEKAVTLEDFPMMPTGPGQLELVDQRYPENGDPKLRREALQKIIQYFPTDKSTLFNAGIKLAIIDWQGNKVPQSIDAIRGLLKSYRGSLGVEDRSWGEYMLGRVMRDDAAHSEEARKLFEGIREDSAVSEYRRSWSDYQIARILESKSPAEAIKALREGIEFNTDAKPDQFTLLAKLLVAGGHIDDLKEEIARMLDKKPPMYTAMLTQLAEAAGNLLPADKTVERTSLIQILEDAGNTADLGKSFYDGLQASRDNIRSMTAGAQIRESLKDYLAKNPPAKLDAAAAQFKTRPDFLRAIDTAENDRKPDLCLRYSIEIITKFEPDKDFPSYLWKAVNNADWNERFHGKPEPLLPVLLDLCDKLPRDTDSYYDGKFLRAKGCARHGDLAGAGRIYEELVHDPKMPNGFLGSARKRYGDNLETRHDYRKALEIYRMSESDIDLSGAKDCLLRAVFLNLEMENRDEALRVLGILAGADADSIKRAGTGAQITEMVALARDRKKADAYWDASAKWRPAWIALEQKLGMKSQGDAIIIPAIPDLTDLGKEMGAAMGAKDRDTYYEDLRKLAHGAFWQPGMVNELASMLTFYTTTFAPECADDLRRFVLLLSDNFVSDDPSLVRKMQFYAVVNCIDTYQYAKAVKIIRAFEAVPQADDGFTQGMARLWGSVARQEKSEVAPAMAALEKTLASPNLQDQRGRSVTILADLYRMAERGADEEKLLKQEMENPQIKSIPADLQTITTRYNQLTKEGTESKQFLLAVEHWIQKQKPSWYDFAEPKSLEDPRLTDLDTVLKNPDQLFTTPEVIKLQLLVASSPTQSYDVRGHAFLQAMGRLVDLASTREDATKVCDGLIDDPEFPEWMRVELLWSAICNARFEKRAAGFEKLRANPLAAKFNQRTKESCETFHAAMAVDATSGEAIGEFCGKLLQNEINDTVLGELRKSYTQLLQMGGIEAATGIYRGLASAKLGSDLQAGRAALQLEFLRSLNHAKKWMPAATAMRQLVLAQYPPDGIKEPPAYSTLQYPNRFYFLQEDVAEQIRLFQIKTQQIDPSDIWFWKAFIHDLPRTEAGRKLIFNLIAAALQNAPGDVERSETLALGDAIDLDDAVLFNQFSALLQPYRNAVKFPQTYGKIRMIEIQHALRTGLTVNVEADFTNLQHPGARAAAQRTRLEYYIRTQNLPLLRQAVDSIPPDELLSGRLLRISLNAFELLGMTEELQLAKDAAKKAIYREVLDAWTTLDANGLYRAYKLADEIHEKSAVPPECFTYLCSVVFHRLDKAFMRTYEATAREDWPHVLSISNEAIALFPTYYHFYWMKGAALYHMGKQKEAIEPLQVYARYSQDEAEYPQAANWLKEIQPAK